MGARAVVGEWEPCACVTCGRVGEHGRHQADPQPEGLLQVQRAGLGARRVVLDLESRRSAAKDWWKEHGAAPAGSARHGAAWCGTVRRGVAQQRLDALPLTSARHVNSCQLPA